MVADDGLAWGDGELGFVEVNFELVTGERFDACRDGGGVVANFRLAGNEVGGGIDEPVGLCCDACV